MANEYYNREMSCEERYLSVIDPARKTDHRCAVDPAAMVRYAYAAKCAEATLDNLCIMYLCDPDARIRGAALASARMRAANYLASHYAENDGEGFADISTMTPVDAELEIGRRAVQLVDDWCADMSLEPRPNHYYKQLGGALLSYDVELTDDPEQFEYDYASAIAAVEDVDVLEFLLTKNDNPIDMKQQMALCEELPHPIRETLMKDPDERVARRAALANGYEAARPYLYCEDLDELHAGIRDMFAAAGRHDVDYWEDELERGPVQRARVVQPVMKTALGRKRTELAKMQADAENEQRGPGVEVDVADMGAGEDVGGGLIAEGAQAVADARAVEGGPGVEGAQAVEDSRARNMEPTDKEKPAVAHVEELSRGENGAVEMSFPAENKYGKRTLSQLPPTKDGHERVGVCIPYGVPDVEDANGKTCNVSGYSFVVDASAVSMGDDGSVRVSLPAAVDNREWLVFARKKTGHWSVDDAGKRSWVEDGTERAAVRVSDLKAAMDSFRDNGPVTARRQKAPVSQKRYASPEASAREAAREARVAAAEKRNVSERGMDGATRRPRV